VSTRSRSTGTDPEFRWVIGGKRSRLSLVRRLSLSFEIRRVEGARRAELWIFAEECIHRWAISADALGGVAGAAKLAPELDAFPLWAAESEVPPRWDRGRCVIEAHSFGRLRDGLTEGLLSFWLQGQRVHGAYRLEKTPMAFAGRPQWVICADDSPDTGEVN
jgi:hypothetical protein